MYQHQAKGYFLGGVDRVGTSKPSGRQPNEPKGPINIELFPKPPGASADTETVTQEKDDKEATMSMPTPPHAQEPVREIFSQQTDLRGKHTRDQMLEAMNTEPNAAWPPKLGPSTCGGIDYELRSSFALTKE